jgi:hypothetical protein
VVFRTLYYDSKTYKPDPTLATPKEGQDFLGDYEKGLLTVGRFDTVSLVREGPLDQGTDRTLSRWKALLDISTTLGCQVYCLETQTITCSRMVYDL